MLKYGSVKATPKLPTPTPKLASIVGPKALAKPGAAPVKEAAPAQ